MKPEPGPDSHSDHDSDSPSVWTRTEAQAPSWKPLAGSDCKSKLESDLAWSLSESQPLACMALPFHSDPHNMSLYQIVHTGRDILKYIKKSC